MLIMHYLLCLLYTIVIVTQLHVYVPQEWFHDFKNFLSRNLAKNNKKGSDKTLPFAFKRDVNLRDELYWSSTANWTRAHEPKYYLFNRQTEVNLAPFCMIAWVVKQLLKNSVYKTAFKKGQRKLKMWLYVQKFLLKFSLNFSQCWNWSKSTVCLLKHLHGVCGEFCLNYY